MHFDKGKLVGIFCMNIVQLTAIRNSLIGCFEDSDRFNRVLNGDKEKLNPNGSNQCRKFCHRFRYFGTESGEECFCGDKITVDKRSSNCTYQCEGNPDEYCGGHWRILIYDTWHCIARPCKNGAICVDIDSKEFICNCSEGWEGDTCENEKHESSSSVSTNHMIIRTSTTINNSVRTNITTNSPSGTNTRTLFSEKRESFSSVSKNHMIIRTSTTINNSVRTNITTNSPSGTKTRIISSDEENSPFPLMYVLLPLVALVVVVTLIVVLVVCKRRNHFRKASSAETPNDKNYSLPYSTVYSIPANETESEIQNKLMPSYGNVNKGNDAASGDNAYAIELEEYNVINLRVNNGTIDDDSYDHMQRYSPRSQNYSDTTYNKLKLCKTTGRDRDDSKDAVSNLYDRTDHELADRIARENALHKKTKLFPNAAGDKETENVEENVYSNDEAYNF